MTSDARILFFGSLADHFGRSLAWPIPADGVSIAALRTTLAERHPAILAPGVRAAVGQAIAGDDVRVRPGDEIAFFSPVSGG